MRNRFRRIPSKLMDELECAHPTPNATFKKEINYRVKPAYASEVDPMRRLAKNNSYRAVDGSKPFWNGRGALTVTTLWPLNRSGFRRHRRSLTHPDFLTMTQ